MQEAAKIIDLLGLARHPEGGWYRETWRHEAADGGRGAGTGIFFLLARGEKSAWHRVDATEIWHFYAGAPLRLSQAVDLAAPTEAVLGPDLLAGERPQLIVPPHVWQAAESLGDWTLVGCTVSPAFEFAGFEMAK